MKLYHLSERNLDGKMLYPRIPCNKMTEDGLENSTIPRICFSPSIKKCLMAINKNNLKNKRYYVHIIETKEYCNISRNLVPDALITKEKWVLHPVKLRCIGTIKVKGLRKIKKYYSYEWKYKWIDRASERQIKLQIQEHAELMAKSLAKGKDLEIRKSVNGVSIAEVKKNVIAR